MRKSIFGNLILCTTLLFGCGATQQEVNVQEIQQNYVYVESENFQNVKEALKVIQNILIEEGTRSNYTVYDKGEFLTDESTEPLTHIFIEFEILESEDIVNHYIDSVERNQTQFLELDFNTLCDIAKIDHEFITEVLAIYGVKDDEFLLKVKLIDETGKTVIFCSELADMYIYKSEINDQEKTTAISIVTGEQLELD